MSTQNHEVWNNGSTPMFLTNPTTSVTLSPTTGTGSVVLTNSNGTFLVNGQPSGDVSTWSVYPTTSNTIKMDSTHNLTSSGNNLYFNGNLIANASDIQNIGDWALYNAVSDIKLSNLGSNYSITGAKNITAISNVSAGSVTSSGAVSGTTGTFTTQVVTPTLISASNLSVSATSALTQYCGTTLSNNAPTISNSFVNTYSILGDKGSDYTDFCYTTLSNKGGKGGQINLVADAGSVTISGTTYGIGGLVNITANSPLTLPYNATSAIKLSAASILSYAGAVTPLGSLAGYNYIQGTLGVNIVAGSASSIPNTAGTIYLYGANGTKLQNGLYLDTLANYPGSNLNIHPDSAVDMTKVQFIGMGSATNESKSYPVIRGDGSSALYGFSSVSASNALLPALVTYNISNAAIAGFGVSDITITASSNSSSSTNYNVNLRSSSNINLSAACNVVVNDVNFTTSGSGWATGSNHTLYGDVAGGAKYIRWSYNNTPGTQIADNNSIELISPLIQFNGAVNQLGDVNMYNHNISNVGNEYFQYGGRFTSFLAGTQGYLDIVYPSAGSGHSSDGVLRIFGGQTNGDRLITLDNANIGITVPRGYGLLYLEANIQVDGNMDMNNNNINNVGYITGVNRNALVFGSGFSRLTSESNLAIESKTGYVEVSANAGAGNMYLTAATIEARGNLNMTNNNISNCARLEGASGFLTVYASAAMTIENGLGCRQALNTDGSFELKTTGSNQTIYLNTQEVNFNGGSNNRITGLGHIYGNTASSGGGLAMDYVYYIGFNGAGGNNASLYASGGNYYMTNNAGGTYIANYSAAGAGDISLYSQSNNIVLATGTGSVITNSIGTVYINSYSNDIILSTIAANKSIQMNTGTIVNTTSANYYITATGSAELRASFFNFFNDCYFNNKTLNNVGGIAMTSGSNINMVGGSILNVGNMTGSNLTISTGGNLTLTPTGTTNFSTDINLSQHIISNVGGLTRTLNSTPVAQPVIQYGTATGSGTSGTAVVTLSPAYASSNSYVVQVTMRDAPTAQLYATPTASNSFTIGWSSAGTGAQNIMWTTFGT